MEATEFQKHCAHEWKPEGPEFNEAEDLLTCKKCGLVTRDGKTVFVADEFELAAVQELEAIAQWLRDRRRKLTDGIMLKSSHVSTSRRMDCAFGKMHAIGSVDAAVWHLIKRAKGDYGA